MFRKYKIGKQARKIIHLLNSLNERELQDIGIESRGQIKFKVLSMIMRNQDV